MRETLSRLWRTWMVRVVLAGLALAGVWGAVSMVRAGDPAPAALTLPATWELSAPLISPQKRDADISVCAKDPTVVFAEGKWHVFMSIRCQDKTVPMEYLNFEKWEDADAAPRHVLRGTPEQRYRCAPEVFYFRPHKKWYLFHQLGVKGRKFMQVSFSTSQKISDPGSWTPSQSIFRTDAEDTRAEGGLDYWIICDQKRAYLFFTNLKGKMWRMWTDLAQFPYGFRDCQVAIQGDIFEASHTYRLKGMDKYLTLVEANPGGKRYYKAFQADTLDGKWTELKGPGGQPFAWDKNVRPAEGVKLWTDNISHGELLRDGHDETLTVDPARLRFLIQGVLQKDKPGSYGLIPWRLGLLTAK